MTIFLVCLAVFVAISVLYASVSIVGDTLCNLTGCSKQTGLTRAERKTQEALHLVEQIKQEHREHIAQLRAMDEEHNRIMAERFRNEM